jgi:hypothetical protein
MQVTRRKAIIKRKLAAAWIESRSHHHVERWESEREAPRAKEKPRRALYGKMNQKTTG